MEKIYNRFKEIFWDAFHRPQLESEKFYAIWNSLEHLNEILAGPLYGIYSGGNCDYLLEDNNRFPNIKDVDDLLDYLTFHVETYKEKISEIEATNEKEKVDKQVLLFQTDLKMELASLAYEIQKLRVLNKK
jgi:hypothetical protein